MDSLTHKEWELLKKSFQMSVRTLDRWRSMNPMKHIWQAGTVWIIGRIGSGRDALKVLLEGKLKGKRCPRIVVSEYGFMGLSPALANNDVIIHTRRGNPLGYKVYRVVVKKRHHFIFSVGLIQMKG